MAGIKNDVVYGLNADFSRAGVQTGSESNGLVTDSQLWIGATAVNVGGTHVNVGNLISPNNSVIFGYASPNITAVVGGAIATTYVEDSGSATPAANILNIVGLSGSKTSGTSNVVTIKSPPFTQIGASATSSLNSGEFVTAAVTRTLPISAGLADGDLFIYSCTTAAALVIQAVGAQKIRIGTLLSSAAGTATSTAIGDSVTLRFDATQGFFMAVGGIGTWVMA